MAPPLTDDLDAQLTSVAALGEPVRRALYRYVVEQPDPVSRDQAAAGVGVAHHVAKFHLDRLESDGLLEVEYRRPPGRGGPGAGRPTKLYRRTAREIAVHLPDRHYDLAGRIMAEAITNMSQTGTALPQAMRDAAVEAGRGLAATSRADSASTDSAHTDSAHTDSASTDRLDAVCRELAEHGYEPRTSGDRILLHNCPFHLLARDYVDLVCGLNLDLIGGLLEGLGRSDLHPRLDPEPGRCCVAITRADVDGRARREDADDRGRSTRSSD
jgi:predicted ArsR family transcriptional regulator